MGHGNPAEQTRAKEHVVTVVQPHPRRRLVVIYLLLATFALYTGAPALVHSQEPDEPFPDVLPGQRAGVDAATEGELDEYTLAVTLDPATSTVSGTEQVIYRNSTGIPQSEVYFRLFPNAEYYGEGALTVGDLTVGGEPVTPELSASDTVLRVPLPDPVPANAEVSIDLRFETVVPTDTSGSFAILNRSSFTGTWSMSDWYPGLAGYEPDRGWRIDPPTSFGDPTFAETARYDVTITAPADLTLVTTGIETDATTSNGLQTRQYAAAPARDFSFAVDDDYVSLSAGADGTIVTAFVNPGQEAGGQAALDVAVSALAVFGERFGPYPHRELDIVAAPLAGALGVSWSGIVFLDGPGMLDILAQSDPAYFNSVVAHEIGHQWWGGQIGFNSNDHTFLLEGITNYSAFLWIEATAGPETALAAIRTSLAAPYIALIEATGDQVADLPIADGQSGRGTIFYNKSALGFFAINETIGDAAFTAGLETLAVDFAFAIAEPTDVLAAFETASGQELGELWRFWFEAAETTPADVEALVA